MPLALVRALESSELDLDPLRAAIQRLPQRASPNLKGRIASSRKALKEATESAWRQALAGLEMQLPLLILDEAHHVKNPNKLAGLFANEASDDVEALRGPLGHMFERMLFLTATPFQLGHHELLRVLDRFHGIRWSSAGGARPVRRPARTALEVTRPRADLRVAPGAGMGAHRSVAGGPGQWAHRASTPARICPTRCELRSSSVKTLGLRSRRPSRCSGRG